MTKTYNPGDKVIWLSGTKATVQYVAKNGVWIGYWGQGLQEGRYVRRRVSRSDIRPVEVR